MKGIFIYISWFLQGTTRSRKFTYGNRHLTEHTMYTKTNPYKKNVQRYWSPLAVVITM